MLSLSISCFDSRKWGRIGGFVLVNFVYVMDIEKNVNRLGGREG